MKASVSRAGLTELQFQVVVGLASSKTVKEMALDREVSPKTIEYHRAEAARKLAIPDVAGMTRWAIRRGHVEASLR